MRKKYINAAVLAAGLTLSASTIPYNAEAATPVVMSGNFHLVPGQIGEVVILQDTLLYKQGSNHQMTNVRTLKKGSIYRVYSVSNIGGITYYGVGAGCYVKATTSVKYLTPSKTVSAAVKGTSQSSTTSASTVNTQLVQGQIGEVTILQDTLLYKQGSNHQMTNVRTLKKGSTYRVYSVSNIGGITYYGVGAGCYVKATTSVKYITPSNTVSIAVKGTSQSSTASASTVNMQLVPGQIGEVTILQDTLLYKQGSNQQMTNSRTLKKGSTYRVYFVSKIGGVTYYGVGAGYYVKAATSVKYAAPSKTVSAAVNETTSNPITGKVDAESESNTVPVSTESMQLVPGQTGEVTILQNTILYKLESNQQMTNVRTLKNGSIYHVYSVGNMGGETYYGVGSGCYVKAAPSVKYVSPSKTVSASMNGGTQSDTGSASTVNMQLVKGQIGEVTILQGTLLYKQGSNQQMSVIRTLKQGTTYRVYSVINMDGVTYYGVGGGCYVMATSSINYSPQPILQVGSTGATVKQVQQILNNLAYNVGMVDGNFGQTTKAAVVQFQNANGLNGDGIVENRTWSVLLSGTAKGNIPAGYKYGSDSNSSTNPNGEDIYLGKLGYANVVQFIASTGGGSFFSSIGAHNASYVYGYWFLSGMQNAPRGTSASNWGIQQAKLALNTYQAMKGVYGSKARPVIFIDVESASSGMKQNDYANNQTIYNAFVNYLNQYGQGVKPGTYTSPGEWKGAMGTFSPSTPGAYWVADYPGDIPSNLTTNNPFWVNFPNTNEQAEIWQYYGGNDDYDVAWKLPYEI